jgi:hypothetical protein
MLRRIREQTPTPDPFVDDRDQSRDAERTD